MGEIHVEGMVQGVVHPAIAYILQQSLPADRVQVVRVERETDYATRKQRYVVEAKLTGRPGYVTVSADCVDGSVPFELLLTKLRLVAPR